MLQVTLGLMLTTRLWILWGWLGWHTSLESHRGWRHWLWSGKPGWWYFLLKKGDRRVCSNYKEFTFLSQEEQCGFHPNRGTLHQVCTQNCIMEIVWRLNKYIKYLNIRKCWRPFIFSLSKEFYDFICAVNQISNEQGNTMTFYIYMKYSTVICGNRESQPATGLSASASVPMTRI